MNSFLEPATSLKINTFLGIFQGFSLKDSEDFFYRTTLTYYSNCK